MRIKTVLSLTALSGLLVLSSCNTLSEERQWMEIFRHAETAKEAIVSRCYDGGHAIKIQTKSFTYNTYTDSYRINVQLTWKGTFSSGNRYWASGFLVANRKTGRVEWTPEVLDASLESYMDSRKMLTGIAGTTAVVTLANEMSKH